MVGRSPRIGKVAFRTSLSHRRDHECVATGLPTARVHVVSIPDLYQRWKVLHTDPTVVKAWRSIPFCPTLLTRPTAKSPADGDRRAEVRDRVMEFNTILARVCAAYPQCTADGGAAFKAPVNKEELSSHDYWHPNLAGQATLATLVWGTLGYQP
jgi:hypothetical protein